MRRALPATLLLAASLLIAPLARADTVDRAAVREALRGETRASSAAPLPLPLPQRAEASETAAAEVARDRGPARLLVGLRAHSDRVGVAARLRALGAEVEALPLIGVLAARVPSAATAVGVLRGDPRVAYVERDRRVPVATDPFDSVDPSTGIKYTWYFDQVRAGEAIAAAGGGSSRTVSVIDTGLDVTHPEFGGSARIARTFDTGTGGTDVRDSIGHGTFVGGLIAAIDGNGVGFKGVAGNTRLVAVRASLDGFFTASDLIRGIAFSIRSGADVLNMSLAGRGFSISQARALEAVFYNDVLPVAASGNNGQAGNPIEFPAAALGGVRGGRGIGLSVAATTPSGGVAPFSNHNRFVSLAAPGAGPSGCRFGVFSTLPASLGTVWDGSCSALFSLGGARYGYAEGTSFAAPIAAGIAAVVWQVERRLASEQVADVLARSARQTIGRGWNEFTGSGIVDGAAAAALARVYDVTAPRARGSARRIGGFVRVRERRSKDRTAKGNKLAGGVRYGLLASRNGGRTFSELARGRRRPISATVELRGPRANVLVATACDRNANCGIKRLGRYRP